MSKRHVELPGSARPAKSDAERLWDVDPNSHSEVTLTLRGPELPDADHLPDPALSHEQFESEFGARREDADEVARVLERYGLKVEDVSLASRSMRVSGSVKETEASIPV